MRMSDDRILTPHVGSLPRQEALRDLLIRRDRGEALDAAELARQVEAAVQHVIAKQHEAGIDIGTNGEQRRVLSSIAAQVMTQWQLQNVRAWRRHRSARSRSSRVMRVVRY